MRNVSLRLRNFTLLFCALAFTACTKTPVDVSSLGLKLSAPQLKTSPFHQDIDDLGYAEVSGTCSSLVGTLYISLDKVSWFGIPATTAYTGTSGSGTMTNDSDCADGKFDFYLTKALVASWTGPGMNSDDIKVFYLHGEGVLGTTEDLTISEEEENGPPTRLSLYKTSPRQFAGVGNCEQFYLNLTDQNGHGVTPSSDLSYQIFVGRNQVNFYDNFSDCYNNTNSKSNGTLSSDPNLHSGNVIYKFTGAVGDKLDFKAIAADFTSNIESITLRDPYARVLRFDTSFHRIYKNSCYPVSVKIYQYNGTEGGVVGSSIPLQITTEDSSLKTYADSNCTTSGSFSIPISTNNTTFYVRYETSKTSDTTNFSSIKVASGSSPATEFDPGESGFEIDLSDKSSITNYRIEGPSSLVIGSCTPFDISAVNAKGTPLPVAIDTFLDLGTSNVSGAVGFYSSNICDSPSVIVAAKPFNMMPGTVFGKFYYKVDSSVGGDDSIGGTDRGGTGKTINIIPFTVSHPTQAVGP